VVVILAASLFFSGGASFAGLGALGVRRSWLRRKAVHGEINAVQPANLLVDAGDRTEPPLMLVWKPARLRFMLFMVFTMCFMTVGFLLDLFARIISVPAFGDQSDRQQFADTVVLIGAITLLLVGFLVHLYLRNRRVTLTADDAGITRQSLVGIRRTVRWEDVRLLEVAAINGARAFVLWGTRSHVWWDEILHHKDGDLIPDGISFEEYEERARQLVSLVVTRTGLRPRTFTRALIAPAGVVSATE
jgi:hypothetical protein